MRVAAPETTSPANEDGRPSSAAPPVARLSTAPDHYRHWHVNVYGEVARGTLTVWQSWICNRPNASGPDGALRRFGTRHVGEYNLRRV